MAKQEKRGNWVISPNDPGAVPEATVNFGKDVTFTPELVQALSTLAKHVRRVSNTPQIRCDNVNLCDQIQINCSGRVSTGPCELLVHCGGVVTYGPVDGGT